MYTYLSICIGILFLILECLYNNTPTLVIGNIDSNLMYSL